LEVVRGLILNDKYPIKVRGTESARIAGGFIIDYLQSDGKEVGVELRHPDSCGA
jgi:hypothetical protein